AQRSKRALGRASKREKAPLGARAKEKRRPRAREQKRKGALGRASKREKAPSGARARDRSAKARRRKRSLRSGVCAARPRQQGLHGRRRLHVERQLLAIGHAPRER